MFEPSRQMLGFSMLLFRRKEHSSLAQGPKSSRLWSMVLPVQRKKGCCFSWTWCPDRKPLQRSFSRGGFDMRGLEKRAEGVN